MPRTSLVLNILDGVHDFVSNLKDAPAPWRGGQLSRRGQALQMRRAKAHSSRLPPTTMLDHRAGQQQHCQHEFSSKQLQGNVHTQLMATHLKSTMQSEFRKSIKEPAASAAASPFFAAFSWNAYRSSTLVAVVSSSTCMPAGGSHRVSNSGQGSCCKLLDCKVWQGVHANRGQQICQH